MARGQQCARSTMRRLPGIALALSALALLGCASRQAPSASAVTEGTVRPVPRSTERGATAMPVDAIVLERTSCFGLCPAYRLRVERSGLVTFERQNGRDTGRTARDSIAPSAFLSLVAAAERLGIDSLPERIDGDERLCPVRATDHPTVRIVLTGQNVARRIDHYTGCYLSPELAVAEPLRQLTAFEAAVDSVAGVRRWIH